MTAHEAGALHAPGYGSVATVPAWLRPPPDVNELLPQLWAGSVRRNDAGALRRSAHLLRGSSATLGAVRLSDACARLERTREQDPPVGEQQLAQLREALEEACLALRERLA